MPSFAAAHREDGHPSAARQATGAAGSTPGHHFGALSIHPSPARPLEGAPLPDPSDAFEREAEGVADRVLRRVAPPSPPPDGPGPPDAAIQTLRVAPAATSVSLEPPPLPATGGGRPLDPFSHRFMEARFGHDFSRVRVHTGPQATAAARAVDARAFTSGTDIVFDAGAYAPHTESGRRLLAHELTHVLQQRDAPVLQRQLAPRAGLATLLQRHMTFIRRRTEQIAQMPLGTERQRNEQILQAYIRLVQANRSNRAFLARAPLDVYEEIGRGLITREDSIQVERERSQPHEPDVLARRRSEHFQTFYSTAMQLWGDSARRFPYRIPVDAEGRDIVVTGDPARQAVLNDLADALMTWATEHLHDPTFLGTTPPTVLRELLESGFSDRLQAANREPLDAESIDRNEILPSRALAAFGRTVATGLLVIALVGAAVGAGIVSAAVAAGLLIGVAAFAGIASFLERRQEIEASHYQVSVPESMLHAAGDAVGLSQLIEGITGERLGTGERMGSVDRSESLGTGGGSVVVMLRGSRAYRFGRRFGTRVRPTVRPRPARRGGSGSGDGGGGGGPGPILTRAQRSLVSLFSRLLRDGGESTVIIEGVRFHRVRVYRVGEVLVFRRFGIENVSRIRGRGRLIHQAFEEAALAFARREGAPRARISLETVVNDTWRAYLTRLGYRMEQYEPETPADRAEGTLFRNLFTRWLDL